MNGVDLLFLGTGTSAGVPMIGCHCPVCSSIDPHDKRTRCSVVIGYGGKKILVDTTPELRLQCVANRVDWIDAVVLTHAHADHIMGLDDVRRFNAIRQGPLDIWADRVTHETLSAPFGYAFNAPNKADKVFRPHLIRRFIDGPFEIEGQTWTPIPMIHGKMDVLGFRVGNLAYCTDVSTMPEASFGLLENLDVLVLDALAWHEHPTHFSIDQALAVVERLKPRQTLFTHIAHGLAHAETNARLPHNVKLAYDGQRVEASL
ncbi:MAG: phnP [Phycisphaerales bacterium]|nr:phnP [Phycisphaerales bacterium]